MSTSFPSFCPKIADPLWFSSGERKGDEIDVCSLESQYESWLRNVAEKDKDIPYIGGKAEQESINESEIEGDYEESGDEEEEINDYQDSPEEQNSNLQYSPSSLQWFNVQIFDSFILNTISGVMVPKEQDELMEISMDSMDDDNSWIV